MIRFTGEIDNIEVLDRAFNRVEEYISDFRSIWPNVTKEFYLIEQEHFNSEGAHGASGGWAPLSPLYAKYKEVQYPNKPILQATGALMESLTGFEAADSIYRPDTTELTLGTQREGAIYHQRGSSRMPARPPISLSEEDKRRLQKAIQLPLVQFVRRQGFEVFENAA